MADKYEVMFNEEWEKLKKEKKPLPNIMLLGETGCGKSSLINLVFGKEIAFVNDTKRGTEDFETYEGKDHNLGVNLIDSKGYELSNGESDTFDKYYGAIGMKMEESRNADPFKKIHIIWYCVSVTGGRFQEYDTETLKLLLKDDELKNRVCLVITKCDKDDEDCGISKAIVETAKKELSRVIPAFCVSNMPSLPLDLEKLVEWSTEQLDDSDLREAFVQSQIVSLKAKRNSAGLKIAFYAAGAAAIGAIPIPFSDAILLTPLQGVMVTHIINSYGIGSIENAVKGIIGATIIPMLGRTLVGSIIKVIPAVGQALGSVINGAVAASITSILGCAISQICFVCCEKIAKGEKVDFEEAFSSENIKAAIDTFTEIIKNNEANEFISTKEVDADAVSKFADDYLKEHVENRG